MSLFEQRDYMTWQDELQYHMSHNNVSFLNLVCCYFRSKIRILRILSTSPVGQKAVKLLTSVAVFTNFAVVCQVVGVNVPLTNARVTLNFTVRPILKMCTWNTYSSEQLQLWTVTTHLHQNYEINQDEQKFLYLVSTCCSTAEVYLLARDIVSHCTLWKAWDRGNTGCTGR